jgi:hypothetical protein
MRELALRTTSRTVNSTSTLNGALFQSRSCSVLHLTGFFALISRENLCSGLPYMVGVTRGDPCRVARLLCLCERLDEVSCGIASPRSKRRFFSAAHA